MANQAQLTWNEQGHLYKIAQNPIHPGLGCLQGQGIHPLGNMFLCFHNLCFSQPVVIGEMFHVGVICKLLRVHLIALSVSLAVLVLITEGNNFPWISDSQSEHWTIDHHSLGLISQPVPCLFTVYPSNLYLSNLERRILWESL